jgi:hypothetical protein
MGVEKTNKLVFLSDIIQANWQICIDHFPGALQIRPDFLPAHQ